jgi:hypothetical protein
MLAVATWYDSGGNFMTPSIGTFPITAPGSDWVPGHETFIAPEGAAYLKIALAYLGSTNDIVYVDDVVVKRNSIMVAKVHPEGSIEHVEMRANLQPLIISSLFVNASTWEISPIYTYPNPMTPVQFKIQFTGEALAPGTTGPTVQFRLGISFDGGTSWSYGVVTKVLINNPGVDTSVTVAAAHMLTGMPTHDIKYRMELFSTDNNTPSLVNGSFLIDVLPAPPAGSY